MKHQKQGFRPATPGKPSGEKIIGFVSTTGKGLGFVPHEGLLEDILINAGFLNTALNGDEVEVALHAKREGERRTGEVTRVIARAKTEFVGTLDIKGDLCYLVPDDRKAYMDFLIRDWKGTGAKNGDKAFVRLTAWNDPKKGPEGVILKVIGPKGLHNVEMESIVLEKGFETGYPAQVMKEAEEIERTEKAITPEEVAKRTDFRGTLTFTIDPEDAKDFDDAISFKRVGDGLYEIGVHIADVSHYVRPGTALDAEAVKRSFSVYLVDRTIPMLPEVLSNDVCSLNPNEDKLTFSAWFTMDERAKIHSRHFGRTVINSDKRFTYETAQASLNDPKGEYHEELTILNRIAKIMQKEKYHAGAIEFDQDEIKFKLDENFKPIGVYKKERLDTHKLVEEYMLLANREVAKFIYDCIGKQGGKGASIYRIHDLPDKDKVTDLAVFIKAMGYDLKVDGGRLESRNINALLKQIEGKPEESLIKTATIRSMAKAAYSIRNIGHYGLGFDYYTHFTSPIRRYPDLMVHRVLQNCLDGGKYSDTEVASYQRIALEASDKEISAAEAERASKKYKQVEYMSERVGQVFEGTISGVTEWGIYVEEENTRCEGMVKLKDMTDDLYELKEKTYSVVGTRTKKKYSLGDKVRFKVVKADLERKTLDYIFA